MTNKLWKKALVLGIIVSFIGAGVIPSISGDIGKISTVKDVGTESINYESIRVTLTASSYKISKGNNGLSEVRMEGFVSDGVPGNPRLPYKVYNILVHPDVVWSTLHMEIVSISTLQLEGTYDIEPNSPDIAGVDEKYIEDWENNKEIVSGKNKNVYDTNEKFPEEYLRLLPYSQMRKWKFIKLHFTPLQYNPVSKQLFLIDEVVVKLIYRRSTNELDNSLLQDTVMDDLAPEFFFNYEHAKDWYSTSVRQKDPLVPSYDYVIITTNAIKTNSNKLSAFVTHKQNLGFNVLTITENEYGILTGQAPDGRAEKIRQWLKNNYASQGIEYVLLIGNPNPVGDLPMKMCWPRLDESKYDKDAPTDYFYADLTGNWDYNGNLSYGEWHHDYGPSGGVDLTPEVFVGRIPVYNNDYATLDKILQKTMDYEMDTCYANWRRNVLFPMSFTKKNYEGANLSEQMKDDYLIESSYSYWRMYQQGSAYSSDDSIFPSEEELRGDYLVRDRWADTDFGIVCWWGHGDSTRVMVGYDYHWDGMLFSSNYCGQLDDSHPSFTYQCSCKNGYPEDSNNLGYAILKQGGIATVSASRDCWKNTKVGYGDFDSSTTNSGIGYEYIKRVVQGLPAANSLYSAKASMTPELNSRLANFFVLNLYGDCSLSISNIQIDSITGGLLDTPSSLTVIAVLRNTGMGTCTNIAWNFTFTGGIILSGSDSGIITSISPGGTATISSKVVFGLATRFLLPCTVTVTAGSGRGIKKVLAIGFLCKVK